MCGLQRLARGLLFVKLGYPGAGRPHGTDPVGYRKSQKEPGRSGSRDGCAAPKRMGSRPSTPIEPPFLASMERMDSLRAAPWSLYGPSGFGRVCVFLPCEVAAGKQAGRRLVSWFDD
jgi:hypothetical protein